MMGTIGEPVDVSDGSGRYVRLPREAQTPRLPRRSRSGKENDGEAVSPSQLPPRINSGLTVRISNLQVGAGAPADSSTPQEVESRSLPVICLDDVANTGRSSPRSTRGEGRSRAEEEMGLADNWDLSPGPRARTRMRPDPPPVLLRWGLNRSEAGESWERQSRPQSWWHPIQLRAAGPRRHQPALSG